MLSLENNDQALDKNACINGISTLRAKISELIADKSPQAALALEETLYAMADTNSARKAKMAELFPQKQFQRVIDRLEDTLATDVQRCKDFRVYMEGVRERLGRFASICPRGSWGFAHGVDHEDLIDERNELSETRKREDLVLATKDRLETLHMYATYGVTSRRAPEIAALASKDPYLLGIRGMARTYDL